MTTPLPLGDQTITLECTDGKVLASKRWLEQTSKVVFDSEISSSFNLHNSIQVPFDVETVTLGIKLTNPFDKDVKVSESNQVQQTKTRSPKPQTSTSTCISRISSKCTGHVDMKTARFNKNICFECTSKLVDDHVHKQIAEQESQKSGTSTPPEQKLLQFFDWYDPIKDVDESIKIRLGMTQKPILMTQNSTKLKTQHKLNELFEPLVQAGFKIVVNRTSGQDFDSVSVSYTLFKDISDIVEQCLEYYEDGYDLIDPTDHTDELIMVKLEYERSDFEYIDIFGISKDEYQFIHETLQEELKEQGKALRCYRF